MHPIDVVAVNETTSQGVTCVGAIGGADNSALMIGAYCIWLLVLQYYRRYLIPPYAPFCRLAPR